MRWGTREAPGTEDDEPGPDFGIPYVITKREAEVAVLGQVEQGLDAVIVNPVFLLGPWDWKPSSGRMLLKAASAPILLAPPGGNDFAHVADVAAGILTAAQRGRLGERYILGGEALSYTEAFQLFADTAGRKRRARQAPAAVIRGAGRAANLLGQLTGGEYDVNSASALVSTLPHHFSSARAERELGYTWRPAAEAARDAWEWFVAHGYA
jgi:dihydroflavonol-4-reductase